jgi:uncharacterized membrane protein (UPF0182 family)
LTSRTRALLPTIVIAALLVGAYFVFTEFWTRKLWFDSLSFTGVFTTMLLTQAALFGVFGGAMALLVGASMWLAYRSRPPAASGRSELADRYRAILDRHAGWAIAAPAVVLGAMAGLAAAGDPLTYLSWLNRQPFGTADPYFGLDASFYVFELPVWRAVLGFLLTALVLAGIGAVVVHFSVGSLSFGSTRVVRGQVVFSRPDKVARSSAVRVQLSIIGGLILVVIGLQQLLDPYGFLVQDGSIFTGMHFTDANARVGAKITMAVIAFICAALFFANIFIKRLLAPVASVVLMVVSGIILSMIYPAAIQYFEVKPNEPDKERPFIEAHIAATRQAFGIADVEIEDYAAVTQVSPGQLKNDAEALPGVRLVDPDIVGTTFEQLQQVRGYYTFPKTLDVDRYVIDGKETDAVVAAREIKLSGLPDQQWNNIHTVYTHGNGLVAAYGNRRQTGGAPQWIEKDLPSVGELGDYESRVYFGEQSTQFVIVGREAGQDPIELDTPGGAEGGGERYNVYAGSGGVPMGDVFTRLLYATHFMDLNILLSDRVNASSRILYDRQPAQRVQEVAPWLTLDGNIYPAIVDKRLVWIVDGYTSSDSYPNSERVDSPSATDAMGRPTSINYLRNSVKAVVDATDGSVVLYAWEPDDPILKTYQAAFPGTVKDRSEISPELLAHLRYPADLFDVQRKVLGRYHMTNPAVWYQQSDLWQIPDDPRKTENSSTTEPSYYLSIKWPGDSAAVFSQTSVYVPKARQNLASYLSVVAEATSPDYGKLRVLRMSDTQQIDGPGQTFNAMTTDSQVAQVLRDYTMQGSASAIYGNLLTLPMGSGLLYVLPVYAQRNNTGSYPALTYVIVRFGEHVGIGQTLQEALDKVFQGDAGADTGEGEIAPSDTSPTTTEPATPGATPTATPATTPTATAAATPAATSTAAPTAAPSDAAGYLQQAEDAFTAADQALREGDLGTYQSKVQEARQALDEALKKMGKK